MKPINLAIFAVSLSFAVNGSYGAYVTPKIGGGQVGASMLDIGVTYDPATCELSVEIPAGEIPTLRPLIPPDEFDPSKAWSVLTGKAYNYQYSWNADEPIPLPGGSAIWVELINQTPGLEIYSPGTYTPILGTGGSDTRWSWNGTMTHNRYAVASPPLYSRYTATYEVYFGDSQTGSRDNYQQYDAAAATLTWYAIPEPATVVLLFLLGMGWTARRFTVSF
jgi:hypothetical protein